MMGNKKYILIWRLLFFLGLLMIAMVLSAIIEEKCKAQTVTKDWTFTEPREALVFGFRDDKYLFELGFEYREAYEKEKIRYETFAVPMAFSYLYDLKYKNFTFSFGGGIGFVLQLKWAGQDYNIFGNEITYPDIYKKTWFFLQVYASLSYEVFLITYHVQFSEDWIHPSFGIGFTW